MLAHQAAASDQVSLFGGVALFIVGVVGLIFVFWYFSHAQRLKRRLRNTPVCSIGHLTSHEAGRVVGEARAYRETLQAPLTGRECLYYRVEVTEKRGKHWIRVLHEEEGVEFVVEDGSGKALVDPKRAEVVLDVDGNSSSGTFDNAEPAQEALLARHGRSSTGWVFNRVLRYREAIIGVGEQIAVLGRCERQTDSGSLAVGGPSGAARPALRLVGPADGPVVISDCRSTTHG